MYYTFFVFSIDMLCTLFTQHSQLLRAGTHQQFQHHQRRAVDSYLDVESPTAVAIKYRLFDLLGNSAVHVTSPYWHMIFSCVLPH